MRYFIELSYRGGAYHGWQTQASGVSIQTTLEAVLTQRFRQPIFVLGSGRTDAGVHAAQQFAHFDVPTAIDCSEAVIHSLNCMLPDDIGIHCIFPVRDGDHARYSATSRYYQYQISRQKDVFAPGLAYYFQPRLDDELMNEACHILLKYTDFKSFSKVRANVTHFRCQLEFARWERKNADSLVFHIKANRFLWGMVRTIVGTMIDIGQGHLRLDQFEQLIQARDRTLLGRPAPANGLCLMKVGYPTGVLVNRPAD
ncbi:tRNA pseudouridine(38-40) synthase TruA [Spirosoma pomorum]